MSMISVYLNELNSLRDLDLIIQDYSIESPEPKLSYLEIPGADGKIDVSEALSPIKYNNRKIEILFLVQQGLEGCEQTRSKFYNLLHGKTFKIRFSNDERYYYEGRVSVETFDLSNNKPQITIVADCKPYKHKMVETKHNFESSSPTETKKSIIYEGFEEISPIIRTNNEGLTLVLNGANYLLNTGDNHIYDFLLKHGNNEFGLKGTGSIEVIYREGVL